MMFWVYIGGIVMLASLAMILSRRWGKDRHVDNYLSGLLGWPTFVSGLLMMIPTFIWYDFAIGFIAMAAYEGWQYVAVKRKHAQHDYEQATKAKGEVA